jgi:hypothetical protein
VRGVIVVRKLRVPEKFLSRALVMANGDVFADLTRAVGVEGSSRGEGDGEEVGGRDEALSMGGKVLSMGSERSNVKVAQC